MADQRYALLRLNNQNYHSWKFKMEMLLIRERLWSVISKPMPVPLTDEWLEKDEVARATIGLYLDDNQARLVRGCTSAKAAWDKLREYHDKRSVVYLLKKLARLDLPEGGDVKEHIQIFNELVQRTEDAGQEIPDKLRVALLLVFLPTSFDPLVTAIQQRPAAEITFDLVQSSLMAEAEKRRERANEDYGGDKAYRSNVKKGKGGKSGNKQQQQQKVCNNCHKPGHFWRKCPELQNGESSSKKDEAKAKQANVPEGPLAWMAGDGGSADWIIDSGASRHMTGDRKFFKALDETTSVSVTLADGKKAEVRGTGSGIVVGVNGEGNPVEIELSDVLFVPKLTSGLISVPTFAAKGFKVVFNGSRCEVRNRAGAVAAQGIRHGSLYRLCTPDQAMITVQKGHTVDCQHTWHRRLGHRDQEMVQVIPGKYAEGIKIKDCGVRTVCSSCMEGKMSRTPFPKQAVHDTKEKLDLVHTDLSGPMEATPSGNRYYLCLIDDYTRMTFVYLLRNKSDAAGKIEDFVQFCKTQIGKTPRIIRSDGGGEYVNKTLQEFLRREGIVSQITAPYSPQQNGVAERKNRFLKESTLCMLQDAGLEPKFWGEAVLTAAYIQNRVPSRSIGMSPFEKWYGKKPSLQHFRIFGSEAWVQVPAQKRKKMEVKARKLVFVGYSNEHKAYRFVDKHSGRVTISRDVKFVEDLRMPDERECSEIKDDSVKHNSEEEVVSLEPMVRGEASDDDSFEGYESAQDLYIGESDGDGAAGEDGAEEPVPPTPEPVPEPAPRPVPEPTPQRSQVVRVLPNRSTRGQLPQRLADFEVGLVVTAQDEPASYDEAVSGPEKEEWMQAMREEYKSLMSNNTWRLVDPPANRNIVGCKWVYRKKLDADGKVVRFKARLVAQGFTQRYGYDFYEVYAPVAMQSSFRVLLALAGRREMSVRHLDVKTAYLYGTLSEEIYMRQPHGFASKEKKTQVCRLLKSIYGLKQAARVWHQTISKMLSDLGFDQCKSDSCLYKQLIGSDWMFLLIYVDDILVVCKQEEAIDKIERELQARLEITRLGDISHFLGIEIAKNAAGVYGLNQKAFINKLVKRFGMDGAKGSKFPMDPGYFKVAGSSKQLPDNKEYHSLIGSLLYLSTHTRPDIAASVGILSRKVSGPSQLDWTEARRIVRYLISTADHQLMLGGAEDFTLVGYSDADWAGDAADRKSCSGYLFRLGGATVTWTSKKQGCVSTSTMEAEYVALSQAAQEAVWLRSLLEDINEKQLGPTVIFEDNRSCLDFAALDQQKKRSKHIDTRYHYTRELCSKNIIELKYCASEDMIADILTKPLGSTKVRKFTAAMGLVPKQDDGGAQG